MLWTIWIMNREEKQFGIERKREASSSTESTESTELSESTEPIPSSTNEDGRIDLAKFSASLSYISYSSPRIALGSII